MNTRAVRAIVRKDLFAALRSKAISVPLVVVPVFMLIVVPVVIALVPSLVGTTGAQLEELSRFLDSMPPGIRRELAGYGVEQKWIALSLGYLLAPLYLILPLIVASVIAADSFAGEKERKTLEALLYTPTTDRELLLGKMLSAWVPAVAVGLTGFVVYGVAANAAAWPVMGRIWFPNATWIVLTLWVGPAVAGLGLGAMVLVSSRVGGFQEAFQLGSMVVLPLVVLLIAQATGLVFLGFWLATALGLVVWMIDAVLFWLGVRTFRRDALFARL